MDDTATLPLEVLKGLKRSEKANDRAVRNGGEGQSDLSIHIAEKTIGRVLKSVVEALNEKPQAGSEEDQLLRVLRSLDPAVIALAGLHSVLFSTGNDGLYTGATVHCGGLLKHECWIKGLLDTDPKLAAAIEKEVLARNGAVKYRKAKFTAVAKRKGFTVAKWTRAQTVFAGAWAVACVLKALPEVFEVYEPQGKALRLTINAEYLSHAKAVVRSIAEKRLVLVPLLEQPLPWTGWKLQHPNGALDCDQTFLRVHRRESAIAAQKAAEDGTMAPAMLAVSRLQSVPFRINRRMYEIVSECIARGIDVKGVPGTEVPMPTRDKAWEDMTDLEKTKWKMDAHEAKRANDSLHADIIMVESDMADAKRVLDAPRFWTQMSCDWRGRVYPLCHFNFQREDRVRCLFEFADGLPIGERGIEALKVHVANCGDFDKISKRPIAERIEWVDKNLSRITALAADPLGTNALSVWTKADKPFLFVAACIELTAAIGTEGHVTHLPIAFDGSSNGLQHLSCMTRDEDTAQLVNLLPSQTPRDCYSEIGADVKVRVAAAVTTEHYDKEKQLVTWPNEVAQRFLDYWGDNPKRLRDTCKRNVMTYSYASKKFGMAGQQQTDLMDELSKDVLRKKLDDHPFDGFQRKGKNDAPGRAARFIAGHVYEAIEARVLRPAQAMEFLQTLAKVMAHEGKPVTWINPVGIPFLNVYRVPVLKRVNLWLYDRGVRLPQRPLVADGEGPEMDKAKCANGIAPNVVHSCDSAHLLMVANASHEAGIVSLATVHDSYACLAPQADEMNRIIRAELIRLYETHDILAEIREACLRDITQHNRHKIVEVPHKGNLNLKEIENADYAFA